MTQAMEGIAAAGRTGSTSASADPRLDHRAPTAQIIALPDLHAGADNRDAADPSDGEPILKDWNPLHQIKAKLQVCVGEASLTVGELLSAKEHQVLKLDRGIEQPVDLTIEGKVVARGQLVAVDGHFAVRITELPMALGLGTGR